MYVGYVVTNDLLQGDSAVDAIGWAEERREGLELRNVEKEALGEGAQSRGQKLVEQKVQHIMKTIERLFDVVGANDTNAHCLHPLHDACTDADEEHQEQLRRLVC
jgi:hypothetical protein